MRAPMSWIAEHVELPAGLTGRQLGDALVRVGLEVERVESASDGISGPVVLGRVLSFVEEPQKNGKTIRWCQIDCGDPEPRGIVCGASNFAVDDVIVAVLPGAVLPGPFPISARKTYGHVSDGMICSVRELGIGDDHAGILVLAPSTGRPGDDAMAALGLADPVLDIAVTPDRGYCLSIRGLAREAAAALQVPFRDVGSGSGSESGGSSSGGGSGGEPITTAAAGPAYPVTVTDPVGCDQFSARTVSGMDPTAPSPELITRRLRSAGMRPISLAVDVTNYVMLETGQPLHAFDRAKLSGPIGVRRAAAGEKLRTLDDTLRVLDPDDLVVTDDTGPIALAGVMGGASTEIDEATTALVLEAAHWQPAAVSRAVRRHRLPSEAAKRFERGVDPAIAAVALQRCVELLVEHGGAIAEPVMTVVGSAPPPVGIPLPVSRPAELSGMVIGAPAVRSRLTEVGCQLLDDNSAGAGMVMVVPPSWRPDLTDPADLIEEVVRLEGYDRIPSVLPAAPPGRGLTDEQRLRRTISRSLAAAGYTEVISYPFVSPAAHALLTPGPNGESRPVLRLENPLSDAEPELRTSLLPGLLATVQRNLGRGNRDLAMYEMGLVYLPSTTSSGPGQAGSPGPALPGVAARPTDAELAAIDSAIPAQPRHAAVVLAGDFERPGWWGPARAAGWADAVAAAHAVATAVGATLQVRAAQTLPWHPGRCAQLLLDGKPVGTAGELHPRVIAALELPPRTCAMELDIDAFSAPPPASSPTLTAFPPVLIDLALVVGVDVPAAAVTEAVTDGAGELLESIRLFDVYTDPKLGQGVKSLAFAMRFRAPDRTLTLSEATAARTAAVARAYELTGAEIRS